MIIMITLGIGVFVGFNMEWLGIREPNRYGFKTPSFRRYCVKKPCKATALLRFFLVPTKIWHFKTASTQKTLVFA
mgnify:CR=1 FL=1